MVCISSKVSKIVCVSTILLSVLSWQLAIGHSLVENRVAHIVYFTPVRCTIVCTAPLQVIRFFDFLAFEYWGETFILAVLTENRPFGLNSAKCVIYTLLLSRYCLMLLCVEFCFTPERKYRADFLYVTPRKMSLFPLFPRWSRINIRFWFVWAAKVLDNFVSEICLCRLIHTFDKRINSLFILVNFACLSVWSKHSKQFRRSFVVLQNDSQCNAWVTKSCFDFYISDIKETTFVCSSVTFLFWERERIDNFGIINVSCLESVNFQ